MSTSSSWAPIGPLLDAELSIDVNSFNSLNAVWQEARKSLEQEDPARLNEFKERLRRSWSIETGILENLYLLNRGTTQTLIDQGFHQELIDRASTDTDPGHLIAVLEDHLAAADMIQALLEEGRPLTLHFIRELHAILTRHQVTAQGLNSLGQPVQGTVLRGQWRTQPSFRRTSGGQEVFYAPPEQIEGQMQDLLAFLELQMEENRNFCHLAAWLHHRFTYIHPFQDGNGRVARALVNYLFIKEHLFPVVIDRDEKGPYIDSLESADGGDLAPLVKLLADKEIESIKRALSLVGIVEEQPAGSLVKGLAKAVLDRRRRRREVEQKQFRLVNQVLRDLVGVAVSFLTDELEDFRSTLRGGQVKIETNLDSGGPEDGRAHYYRLQVVESAKLAEQWANFDEESRWVRALVEDSNSRLRVIFSFHHVGRVLTGVGEVTAFADLEAVDSEPNSQSLDPSRRPVYCMLQPFSVTWQDNVAERRDAFTRWLEECLAVALREWTETI